MRTAVEIERTLARLRAREAENGTPDLRTSTMTHLVWAPPEWLPKARATLAGLAERHPARVIFLVPEPGRRDAVEARVALRDFSISGFSREIVSEVIELRLRGKLRHRPGSVVLPLLISDLPVFCRWRGEPPWGSPEVDQLVDVCDRLVVDSSEWRGLPLAYTSLADLFDVIAVSDIAFSRSTAWRLRLAERWPGIAGIRRLRVEGPRADALLLAGWLRSRLGRHVRLTRRDGDAVQAVWVDGEPVEPPAGEPPTPSELLSAELDAFGRDPVFEAAVAAAS